MSKQNLIEVTLAKPHTHAGIDYAAGKTIEVTEPVRDWLIAQKVIITAPAAAKEKK